MAKKVEKETYTEDLYPEPERQISDAFYSVTGDCLLISECQDFIKALNYEGYELTKIKQPNKALNCDSQLRCSQS